MYIHYTGNHYLLTCWNEQWHVIKKSPRLDISGSYIHGKIPRNLIIHANKSLYVANKEFMNLEREMIEKQKSAIIAEIAAIAKKAQMALRSDCDAVLYNTLAYHLDNMKRLLEKV